MKKSVDIDEYFVEQPFLERIRLAGEAGLEYLEFGVWTAHDLTAVGERLRSHGVRLACMAGDRDDSGVSDYTCRDFLEYLSQSLAVAKFFACPNVVIRLNAFPVGTLVRNGDGGGSGCGKITDFVRAMLDGARAAEKAGVTLQMAPVVNEGNVRRGMRAVTAVVGIVRAVGSAHLKLLYHVPLMHALDGNIHVTVKAYADVLGYVKVGLLPEGVPPGFGAVNFPAFKRVLFDELGYDGMVGFGLYPDRTLPDSLDFLKDF